MTILKRLKVPVIQAPMAGISTPELIAAISNSGALGSLGAGYMLPDAIRFAIKQIRTLTPHPFNVNLFACIRESIDCDVAPMGAILSPLWQELSQEPFKPSVQSLPSFDEQALVLLEEKVPVFSFTFGIPEMHWIERFKKQGILVIGTATNLQEAKALEAAGVDAIVCQGIEAGAHRGYFSEKDSLHSLFDLLSETKVKVPLIAAGGIMNGYGVKAAMNLGADAAQLGTAFITTHECGASTTYKTALLERPAADTRLTKAFTGKPARAIVNRLMESIEKEDIPPFPVQHYLTLGLRKLAAEKKRPDLMSLWAGKGYPLCQDISAGKLIEEINNQLKRQ